ncbi:hypothetical protein [Aliarcobacter butzleri]|uniref:Uncharacterized protein n=1 Tax=Aliarcobacter butzleri L352 TaxID=1447260 RepID=A0A837JB92_9BACT|nr:hypothetical protein [Aliarcobacter butzleri]KLE05313.1 hypothetical protein AF77_05140 [Aliarcobacter butzleri L352]
MNGKLIFKMIDDYILGKFDIKKLDNYFQFKNKIEDFDEDLFNKFVNTYKYARTQTNAWDENDITNSLIKDIMTALNNHSNLSFNVFKSKGTYETSFGDIAFIVRFNYKTGKSFEGYGFIEAKRDYPNNNYKFRELKQDQIDRFLQNTTSSFYCFYSHHAFFPIIKTDYLSKHLSNIGLSNIKDLDYKLLTNTIHPITFQHQYNRFINGYDLDYGENPKSIAYGFNQDFLPKTIFVVNQFESGMTPTPTPTPNEQMYKKINLDDLIKNNNDIDDDIGYEPPNPSVF